MSVRIDLRKRGGTTASLAAYKSYPIDPSLALHGVLAFSDNFVKQSLTFEENSSTVFPSIPNNTLTFAVKKLLGKEIVILTTLSFKYKQ